MRPNLIEIAETREFKSFTPYTDKQKSMWMACAKGLEMLIESRAKDNKYPSDVFTAEDVIHIMHTTFDGGIMSNKKTQESTLPDEDHVFESTITATGEKVWQYFYNDENELNQHSEYFSTKEIALASYKNFIGRISIEQFLKEAFPNLIGETYVYITNKKQLITALNKWMKIHI